MEKAVIASSAAPARLTSGLGLRSGAGKHGSRTSTSPMAMSSYRPDGHGPPCIRSPAHSGRGAADRDLRWVASASTSQRKTSSRCSALTKSPPSARLPERQGCSGDLFSRTARSRCSSRAAAATARSRFACSRTIWPLVPGTSCSERLPGCRFTSTPSSSTDRASRRSCHDVAGGRRRGSRSGFRTPTSRHALAILPSA